MFRCANGCDGAGGNGNLSGAAWSATVAFPTAGTIRYFCEAHGAPGGVGMSGVITVDRTDGRRAHAATSTAMAARTSCGAMAARAPTSIWRSASSARRAGAWRRCRWPGASVGLGDYNGDGRSDILWRNSTTGANVDLAFGQLGHAAGRDRRDQPGLDRGRIGRLQRRWPRRHPVAQRQHGRERDLAFGQFRHARSRCPPSRCPGASWARATTTAMAAPTSCGATPAPART